MVSANLVLVTSTREKSFGTLPSGATPKMQEVRLKDYGIEKSTTSVTSQELRSDRQIADRARVGIDAGGPINGEMSYGGMDVQIVAGNISADSGTSKFTGPATTFANVSVGDWVRFYRAGSSNNGYWFVTAKGASDVSITVEGEGSATITTEAAGSECEIAVDSEFDSRLQAAIQSVAWTKAVELGVQNYMSVDGSGRIARTAVALSQTGIFLVASNKINRNDTGSGGSWVTDGIKIGMKILVAGFATALNNGLHTVTAVTAANITVTDSLTNESTPVGAVTVTANFTTDGFEAGMLIRTDGWATAGNNTFTRITSVASGTLTVDPALTTESAPSGAVRVKAGGYIKNGTHASSFEYERKHTDATNLYELATGMYPNAATIAFALRQIGTVGFEFMGKNVDQDQSATIGTGSNHTAGTFSVLNAVDNVYAIRMDGAALGTFVRRVSMRVANNMFAREGFGTEGVTALGAISMGSGSIDVSGEFEAYYEDATLAIVNDGWTTAGMDMVLVGPDSEAYMISMGSVKFTRIGKPVPGLNQDCYQTVRFEAIRDADLLETVRITRWLN